jgi:hypothetical protein
MKLPIVGWTVDERFLMHRLRSTSIAGIAAVLVAAGFFFHGLSTSGSIRWDHFSIIATAAAVKLAVLTWYRLND